MALAFLAGAQATAYAQTAAVSTPSPSPSRRPAPAASPAPPTESGGESSAPALVIAGIGIVVSGVVGPWLTALASRRSDRQRFELDRASARRDDLRDLLDQAAALLAPGASNIRELHDAQASGANRPDLDAWSKQTFTMGQRVRLRLTESQPVVTAYDGALAALVEIPDPAGDQGRYDAAVADFERARSRFLTESREALQAPVKAARV